MRLGISFESSARLDIKCQTLFSLKIKIQFHLSSDVVMFSALGFTGKSFRSFCGITRHQQCIDFRLLAQILNEDTQESPQSPITALPR